jgi:adenine-specific DNA-methyltransferase
MASSRRKSPISGFDVVPKLGFGAAHSGNVVMHSENLAALRALSTSHFGRIKCVYIDPPYRNGERYQHYDDKQGHREWLSSLSERLRAFLPLLRSDGSIWISIDDRELHYLKVAADEVFGRKNYVTTVVWQHRTSRENRRAFSHNHEYILVYAKSITEFAKAMNRFPAGPTILSRYQNPDKDPRGPWQSVTASVQDGHATSSQFYTLIAPNGKRHSPPKGRCWIYNKARMSAAIRNGDVYFGRDGNGVPRIKRLLSASQPVVTPETLWLASDVGTTLSAKRHSLALFPRQAAFDTPKPESLILRVLQIATNAGDYVLDAYLGSGTTAAVAHKTGRHYIGIEVGRHAVTHCADRLRQVVQGEGGGISSEVGWSGGGGFEFLTPSRGR